MTKRKLKVVPDEIEQESLLDKPPWLPTRAAALWDVVVARRQAAGILEEIDGVAIQNLVLSYHFMLHNAALLLKDGVLEKDEAHADRKRKHPAFQMWRESQAAFMNWSAALGLDYEPEETIGGGSAELSDLEKLLSGTPKTKR